MECLVKRAQIACDMSKRRLAVYRRYRLFITIAILVPENEPKNKTRRHYGTECFLEQNHIS